MAQPEPWLLLLSTLGRLVTLTFLKELTASSQAQFVVPSTATVTAAGLAALAVILGHQVGEGSATTATTEPHGAFTFVQLQRPGSVLHTLPLLWDTAGLQVSPPPIPTILFATPASPPAHTQLGKCHTLANSNCLFLPPVHT